MGLKVMVSNLMGQIKMDTLSELQKWYEAECDGNWEHHYGVKIDTLDNPGWLVTIDLTDTNFGRKAF